MIWSVLWLSSMGCAPAPSITGGCARSPDNALRATCTFEVEPPSAVSLVLEADGEPVSEIRSEEIRADHALSVWRMLPETRYAWVARTDGAERSGTLTTGALPEAATLDVARTGGEATDDVMFLVDCGEPDTDERPTAVVIDVEGRVVWYQEIAFDLPEGEHPTLGLTFSTEARSDGRPGGTILALLDRSRVREFGLDGALLTDRIVADGVEKVVHHDVFRRNGRTYALTAHVEEVEGVPYLVDGLYALDADGTTLFEWDMSMIVQPSGPGGPGFVYWTDLFPGARDWTHANGIYVAEDGDVVMSLHSPSTVLRLEGNVDDPRFGTPVWVLDGSGTSPWPSTFAVTDPDGLTDDDTFGHQHHPLLIDDGTLQIFDNGEQIAGEARGLRLALDEEAGTAEIIGSWPIGEVCPIEGSVLSLSNGNLLLTCGLQSRFHEIAPATGAIVGSTTATCAGSSAVRILPRAIPVDLGSRDHLTGF